MPSDWQKIWDPRAKAFNFACTKFPRARDDERNPLIEMLRIEPGIQFLEVSPCGGCLLRGIREKYPTGIEYYAVEPSDENAKDLPNYVVRIQDSDITEFAMGDSCVDRIGNLAGLHHTYPRKGFFSECFRVLRRRGILAIADVLTDSPVARWLNEFVNEFSEHGHEGQFFSEGEMTAELKEAGFSGIIEKNLQFAWHFESSGDAVDFCRNLFYLTKASDMDILSGLSRCLGFEIGNQEVRIPWQLSYASGRKW